MLEVIEEKFVDLTEVKEILGKIKTDELKFEQKNALENANSCVKLSRKDAQELRDKIEALELRTVKDDNITKIIDILPKNMDDMNVIFKNASVKPSDMDLEEILKIVKGYVKE